jgi:thymidine kinase
VIICMKFKEVWYIDSAKQHPSLKLSDLQPVVNWSVSCRFRSQKFNLLVFLIGIANHARPLVHICRFCSQKFNLLVFLIGIADHTGPLVNMHRTD